MILPTTILAVLGLTRPQSEGYVKVNSSDWARHPVFAYNIGSNPEDYVIFAKLVLKFRDVVADMRAQGISIAESASSPLNGLNTIADIVAACKRTTFPFATNWHDVGTVRMGVNSTVGATNSRGHVFDIQGLIIGDNSLMPLGHPGHASASGARDVGAVVAQMIIDDYNL